MAALDRRVRAAVGLAWSFAVPIADSGGTPYRLPADAPVKNIEIRLHQTVLYNSIYRADNQLLVNQHTYGIPAAQAPVFCLRDTEGGEMAALYLHSFERVWASALSLS